MGFGSQKFLGVRRLVWFFLLSSSVVCGGSVLLAHPALHAYVYGNSPPQPRNDDDDDDNGLARFFFA